MKQAHIFTDSIGGRTLRFLAASKDGQWQALCLDLCLAAQADTFPEAERKIRAMVCEYLYDALEGDDRPYASQLLSRRAPLRYWARYYFRKISRVITRRRGDESRYI